MVEYALLVALVAIVAIGALRLAGVQVVENFCRSSNDLAQVNGDPTDEIEVKKQCKSLF